MNARFVDEARSEFMAAMHYYNRQVPGLEMLLSTKFSVALTSFSAIQSCGESLKTAFAVI